MRSLKWISVISFLLFTACSTFNGIRSSLRQESPYEQYVRKLEDNGMKTRPMVMQWLAVGMPELHDSVAITLPFAETGYFPASEPQARTYRFDVKDGQVLTLQGTVKTSERASVFANLFIRNDKGIWEDIAHADSTLTLTHEFDKNYSCLLRIQPELLVDMYYAITIGLTPVLINPVKGATNKSIGSFFGDSRDGGGRKHEGVDIFAPKGTPVIAPTSGMVSRVGTSNLGGKVVWMYDSKRGHSYYFAHLDSQLVTPGTRVKQGDVLGLVGNTGNARTTPAHLHFGIYQSQSKDPVNYIRTMENMVERFAPDTTLQAIVFKTAGKNTLVRSAPGDKAVEVDKLAKDAYVKVIAQSQEWYRVIQPNGREGFVRKKALAIPDEKKHAALAETALLLATPTLNAVPVAQLDKVKVAMLAHFNGFWYVKTAGGTTGWVSKADFGPI
jgi:murein DD-endopeptidase MepM/ murein hydrolase activator NlpD/SH3-like domain-containing protein